VGMLAKIRRMHIRDHIPLREIARRTGLARNGSFAIRVEPRLPISACPAPQRFCVKGGQGGVLPARRSAPLTPYRQNTLALCPMRRFIA